MSDIQSVKNEYRDSHRPARGVLYGLAICAVIWAVIVVVLTATVV